MHHYIWPWRCPFQPGNSPNWVFAVVWQPLLVSGGVGGYWQAPRRKGGQEGETMGGTVNPLPPFLGTPSSTHLGASPAAWPCGTGPALPCPGPALSPLPPFAHKGTTSWLGGALPCHPMFGSGSPKSPWLGPPYLLAFPS